MAKLRLAAPLASDSTYVLCLSLLASYYLVTLFTTSIWRIGCWPGAFVASPLQRSTMQCTQCSPCTASARE